MEKSMSLDTVGECAQKCDRENREGRWRQIKSIYRWHLDLVTDRIHCISCLNAWDTNCATF